MKMNFLNVLQFGDAIGEDLFSDIVIPNGLDKQTLVDTIVYDNWEFDVEIADFYLFKKMVTNFFKKKNDSYNRLYNALLEKYNPLHNYDRYEDRKEKTQRNKQDKNVLETKTTEEDTVSADNSNTYQPRNKTVGDLKENDTRNVEDLEDYTTENHLYGNIGVTTSQQMLESEIKLRMENNMYSLISLDFRREFMILLL